MKYLLISLFATGLFFNACNNVPKTENKPMEVKTDSIPTTVYYCPMHPEVTSDKPGTCPKCGMDLEKK
jgi:Cu(I)/Ag(I) efflux system membrane fusion protein